MTEHELTRRRLLALGLAIPPLAALAGTDLFAGELLAATPAIADDDDPTTGENQAGEVGARVGAHGHPLPTPIVRHRGETA